MRFSLKLALAAMAYVALAAAAISQRSTIGRDALWAVTVLAFAYAAVVSFIATGKRQALALGFLVLTAIYVVGLYLQPRVLSSRRVFEAAGYRISDDGDVHAVVFIAPGLQQDKYPGNFTPAIQSANAICTMAAGLIGCGLGALAYRRGGRGESG